MLTKEEWIERCAKRYRNRTGMGKSRALQLATECFMFEFGDDQVTVNGDTTPEEACDEDLSYWTNDDMVSSHDGNEG